jgi:hypothetical protein
MEYWLMRELGENIQKIFGMLFKTGSTYDILFPALRFSPFL